MNPEVAYSSLLETSAIVGQVVLIAMLLERALAFLFEYHWFEVLNKRVQGLKAPIAYLLSLFISRMYGLDVMAEIFRQEGEPVVVTWIGSFITAGVIAGGSAGAIVLFQNWFNWGRESRNASIAAKTQTAEALKKEAEARHAHAEAERIASLTRKIANTAEFEQYKAQMIKQLGDEKFHALMGPAMGVS
ncbi:MAG: hypothetical protein WD801_03670 [Gemmatimonadaceae bacterium]